MRNPDLMAVEQKYLRTDIPEFRVGDTIRVTFRLSKEEIVSTGDQQQKKEGRKEREPVAMFEGVVIRKRGEGTSATITLRKIAHGVGTERTFFLHSPNIVKIEVLRRGKVRRARLYYLRGLSTKEARIKEDRKRAMMDREAQKIASSQQ
ncbi:50S ribosomal protein L19 [Fervidibacter sacchari]|uniref:Large ribosomal subunit protein bL19 n=1 Tax=Candidatus Fervidibacter sacchari TaxID=1448929 RepID=A0ABT2EPS2_9BACT|nr:50S ribosomal protein L19 [Candidatus Fervidibacter sacchari]MCS3919957.1 large subunit ribosomal protein L19 [Candidatus Fervidibacter sacchari]WKU16808.1 50S ribosomal protein L19 [Candidatus Fervidibacter sacchari]